MLEVRGKQGTVHEHGCQFLHKPPACYFIGETVQNNCVYLIQPDERLQTILHAV